MTASILNIKGKKVNNLINPTSTFRQSQTIDEANLIYEEIGDNQHASEVFIVSNDDSMSNKSKVKNDEVQSNIKYSSAENMMIPTYHDKGNDNVYSDKLPIAVNGNDKHDEVVNVEDFNSFDPVILDNRIENRKFKMDVEDTLQDQAIRLPTAFLRLMIV